MNQSQKLKVNSIARALEIAGLKFDKDDVRIIKGCVVRLSFDLKRNTDTGTDMDRIIKELRQLGYTIYERNIKNIDGRRWYSLEVYSETSSIRYVTVDEVYCTVYIDF